MKIRNALSVILSIAVILSLCACSNEPLPQCEPANLSGDIMKNEDGYYYIAGYKSVYNGNLPDIPFYYDSVTSESIILCSKPQCLHDGNPFCTATAIQDNTSTRYCSYTLYNNYIYKVCTEVVRDEPGTVGTEQVKLSRYDLQGNGRSEIASLSDPVVSGDKECVWISQTVFHYGKMFYIKSGVVGVKPQICMLDLNSGYINDIIVPDAEKYERYLNMTADGDWLYYAAENIIYNTITGMQRGIKATTYRYNIRTGETETLSAMPEVYSSFTVNDGIIYYTVVDRSSNTFNLYAYDTANDETKTVLENCQQTYLDGKYLSDPYKVTVLTDRHYLYVLTNGEHGYKNEADIDFYIFDFDGNKLFKGLSGKDFDNENCRYRFNAIEGEIFLFYDITSSSEEFLLNEKSGLFTIKTEDLINGSTEWKKLYKYKNM